MSGKITVLMDCNVKVLFRHAEAGGRSSAAIVQVTNSRSLGGNTAIATEPTDKAVAVAVHDAVKRILEATEKDIRDLDAFFCTSSARKSLQPKGAP